MYTCKCCLFSKWGNFICLPLPNTVVSSFGCFHLHWFVRTLTFRCVFPDWWWLFRSILPKNLDLFERIGQMFFACNSFISHLDICIYLPYNINPSFSLIFIFRIMKNWKFIFVIASNLLNIFCLKFFIFFLLFCRRIIAMTTVHTTLFNHNRKYYKPTYQA